MANYPFKINIQYKNGTTLPHYTSSFATDADTAISASDMVGRINSMPVGAVYTQDIVATNMHGSRKFGDASEGSKFISASYITSPNTGSVVFTDTEDTTNDGLDFYTFWGTKVCNVLGLPEGIPIYTETFKLSDDSSNPSNYLSGNVIADGIAIRESFKMAPQARMRSNLVWDHQFGEGFLQWVSGSNSKLLFGYDDQADTYLLSAASAATFNISGVDSISTTKVLTNLIYDDTTDVAILAGITAYDASNYTNGQLYLDTAGFNYMHGALSIQYIDIDAWDNESTKADYGLVIANRGGSDTVDRFAGIAFDVGTERDSDSIAGAIAVLRNDTVAASHAGNMIFCTNNAGASDGTGTSDDDLRERLRITHDGLVGIGDPTPSYTLDVAGTFRATGDINANGNIVGDDTTDITNIESIYCDYVRADADGADNYINYANDEISIVVGGAERLSIQDNAIIINEGGVDVNFRVESEDQSSMLRIDGALNTLGIGVQGRKFFHVACDLASEYGTSLYAAYGGALWERSRASNANISSWITSNINTSTYRNSIIGPASSDDNIYFYFRDDGAESSQWYINVDGDANNFTGQHTVNIVSGSSLLNIDWKGAPEDKLGISGSNINEFVGKIVYATGEYQRWDKINRQYVSGSNAIEINEALPIVDMVSSSMDKRVFGVLSDREDHLRKDPDSGDYENDWQMTSGSEGATPINAAFNFQNLKFGKVRVNSIGEGAIWICNTSGSLENGDYITTCKVPGYGSKQNDNILHNYTVAKITTDCDFTTGNYKTGSTTHNGVTYKTAFVGCTYHCG